MGKRFLAVLATVTACPRQSGDTTTRLAPHAEQRKRFNLAMFGKGVSGGKPIASKLMGVERRHCGLQHVTQTPATPRDWRPAMVGGAMAMRKGSVRACPSKYTPSAVRL
jgi:hypothetical protein